MNKEFITGDANIWRKKGSSYESSDGRKLSENQMRNEIKQQGGKVYTNLKQAGRIGEIAMQKDEMNRKR